MMTDIKKLQRITPIKVDKEKQQRAEIEMLSRRNKLLESQIAELTAKLTGQTALAARRQETIDHLRQQLALARIDNPSSWLEVPSDE